MPQLPKMRQFKNRVALKGAYKKFKRYISDYNFMSIEEADKAIDWDTCSTLTLEDLTRQKEVKLMIFKKILYELMKK